MDPSTINWLAVVVSTLAFYGIGAIWYSVLFGKAWMKEIGITPDDTKKVNMVKMMSLTFILSLIMVTNLAFFISSPTITGTEGALYGFLTGFGWVSMAIALNALYEGRSWKYMAINAGYLTVGFTLSGFILGAWK
jgi:hypothetical protein